jgi:hypothetical protein
MHDNPPSCIDHTPHKKLLQSLTPIIAIALAVLSQVPLASEHLLPIHDGMHQYQVFHIFYSEFLANGDLIRWFPYGSYGVQSYYWQWNALTPMNYLIGILGNLAGAQNTLWLFKISILIDVVIFACGMAAVAARLFRAHLLVQWMVIVGGIFSLSFIIQPYFNFYAYYALPWVIYFLTRYIEEIDGRFLWLAGIVEVASLPGNLTYIPFIHAFGLALFMLPSLIKVRGLIRAAFTPRAMIPLGIFIFLALVFGTFASNSIEYLEILGQGRDPLTGEATLDSFLNFGRFTLANHFVGFLTGAYAHSNNTYYIGLLPLALFAYGLFTVRHLLFLGIAGWAVFLIWLSVGGLFTTLVYYIPGISIYRHIGLVFGIAKILILLASGYGAMHLLNAAKSSERISLRMPTARQWSILGIILLLCADIIISWRPNDGELAYNLKEFPIDTWWILVAARVAIYGIAIAWLLRLLKEKGPVSNQRLVLIALLPLIAFLFDIASFQSRVILEAPFTERSYPAELFKAAPIPMINERSSGISQGRPVKSFDMINRKMPYRNAVMDPAHMFGNLDPCQPITRSIVYSFGVPDSIRARGGNPSRYITDSYLPKDDPGFLKSLGCESPKFWLAKSIKIVTGMQNSVQHFSGIEDPSKTIILTETGTSIAYSDQIPSNSVILDFQQISFSPNSLTVKVILDKPGPAWLVYADGYNPMWEATVNEISTPVIRANVGFKALFLHEKENIVTLTFTPGLTGLLSYAVAILAAICALVALLCIVLWALPSKIVLSKTIHSP